MKNHVVSWEIREFTWIFVNPGWIEEFSAIIWHWKRFLEEVLCCSFQKKKSDGSNLQEFGKSFKSLLWLKMIFWIKPVSTNRTWRRRLMPSQLEFGVSSRVKIWWKIVAAKAKFCLSSQQKMMVKLCIPKRGFLRRISFSSSFVNLGFCH